MILMDQQNPALPEHTATCSAILKTAGFTTTGAGIYSCRGKQMTEQLDKVSVVTNLNKILELELAGVVRYTHYALMIFGYNRIPIVSWMQAQADELALGPLLESHKHDISDILRESLEHEREALGAYRKLFALVEDRSVLLEEYARRMISLEEMHQGEVDKMLRKPGEVGVYTD
jgi:bacterioferritin